MKTIIWDYNGTILNDVSIAVKIENEMLLRRGLKADYTLDDYKSLFSVPMEDYYRKIGYTFKNESFHDAGVEFYGLYEKYFSECTLNKGVLDKLQEAKEKGYQNIILSSQIGQRMNSVCAATSFPQSFHRCTLPVPSPPMSFVTSETFTRLKSPMTECFRQLAATANSSADCLSS